MSALPFDFCGGFVGYLGYELKRECGAAANQHASPFPDAAFFLADRLLAVEHTEGDVYLVELVDTEGDRAAGASTARSTNAEDSRQKVARSISEEEGKGVSSLEVEETTSRRPAITAWIETTADLIRRLSEAARNNTMIGRSLRVLESRKVSVPAVAGDHSSADEPASAAASQYVADVQRCMDEIRNGETYEVSGQAETGASKHTGRILRHHSLST